MKTRDEITVEHVYRSIHAVGINGDTWNRTAMEVFKRADGTWGMEWHNQSFREVFATMEQAVEAAIPHVLNNANGVRGF